MNDQGENALNEALADELRAAQLSERLSAPKLEELTGIGADTIRRTLKGERPVTVVELVKYAAALNFDELELVTRAKERAQATLGRSAAHQSVRLREKLTLIATSAGKTTDGIYLDVVNHMTKQGFNFSRKSWQDLLDDSGAVARREVLFAIASALDVDPRYLTSDDPAVDREVEGRLRFHRAMVDLGVEEVAARAISSPSPEELDEIARSIAQAIEDYRSR